MEIVKRHDHGESLAPVEALGELEDFELVTDIKKGGRLVEHECRFPGARVRAIQARWRSPPDRESMARSAKSVMPVRLMASSMAS